MINDDMMHGIEYLRERADVTYEEAADLLERNDGNVMRVLVELEREGRVYANGRPAEKGSENRDQAHGHATEAKQKSTAFLDRAFSTRLVVEKKRENGEKETVANLSMPFVVGGAVLAPYLAAATVAVAFVTGHNVKLENTKDAKEAKDVKKDDEAV